MIRFAFFPRGRAHPDWAADLLDIFRHHEVEIGAQRPAHALTSEEVLAVLGKDLEGVGFHIERRKLTGRDGEQRVFLQANGTVSERHHFDVYHPEWLCCLAIESRRTRAQAMHPDFVEPMIVADIDTLCLAVPNSCEDLSVGEQVVGGDYDHTYKLAESAYAHARVRLPYALLLIGY